MKSDFRNILVDTSRYREWDEKKTYRTHRHIEDAPMKESMRSRYRNRKDFADNIAPLFRYLRSNVGRPWNAVYSEIREQINPRSTMDAHLLRHVREAVRTHDASDAGGSRRGDFRVDAKGILREI